MQEAQDAQSTPKSGEKPTQQISPKEKKQTIPAEVEAAKTPGEAMRALAGQKQEQTQQLTEFEQRARVHAKWLAGMFEAGGSMIIGVGKNIERSQKNGVDYLHASPIVQYTDNSLQRITALNHIFGGKVRDRTTRGSQSWDFTIRGNQVVRFALAFKDYAPSRATFMDLMQKWHILSREQQASLAKSVQKLTVAPSVYSSLVKDPEFMAGVFEARGQSRVGSNKQPILGIMTTNVSLLEAIRDEYAPGTKIEDFPYGGNSNAISHRLQLKSAQARELYLKIKPHLLLRQEITREAFGDKGPEFIKQLALSSLASEARPVTTERLRRQIVETIGVVASVSPEQINQYITELASGGYVTAVRERKKGRDYTKWLLNLENPRNLPVIEHSPVAIEVFLKKALQGQLVLSQTGQIIANGLNFSSYQWFPERTVSAAGRRTIQSVADSGLPFQQLSDSGRTLNVIRSVRAITDMRQLDAVRDAIENAIAASHNYVYEHYDELGNPPLPERDPKEITREILESLRK